MKKVNTIIIENKYKEKWILNYPFRQYPIRANNILTPYIDPKYIDNVKKLYHDI